MAWCLTAPSHYLNQYWLVISEVQRHSYQGHFTRDASTINHWNTFENYISKISFKFPRDQWVNRNQNMYVYLVIRCIHKKHIQQKVLNISEIPHLSSFFFYYFYRTLSLMVFITLSIEWILQVLLNRNKRLLFVLKISYLSQRSAEYIICFKNNDMSSIVIPIKWQ